MIIQLFYVLLYFMYDGRFQFGHHIKKTHEKTQKEKKYRPPIDTIFII